MIDSFALRCEIKDLFLIGLEFVLMDLTEDYITFAKARSAIEEGNQDWFEESDLFGPLTPKEKIICLNKVATMFLHSKNLIENEWCEMWFQATCYVILKEALTAVLEIESDSEPADITIAREVFCKTYNKLFKKKAKVSDDDWQDKVENFWNYLVEYTSEPWADDDFQLLGGYFPKSDESDFRRSLADLLKIVRKNEQA